MAAELMISSYRKSIKVAGNPFSLMRMQLNTKSASTCNKHMATVMSKQVKLSRMYVCHHEITVQPFPNYTHTHPPVPIDKQLILLLLLLFFLQ